MYFVLSFGYKPSHTGSDGPNWPGIEPGSSASIGHAPVCRKIPLAASEGPCERQRGYRRPCLWVIHRIIRSCEEQISSKAGKRRARVDRVVAVVKL